MRSAFVIAALAASICATTDARAQCMFGDKTLGQGWTTAPCPRSSGSVSAVSAAASGASAAGSAAAGLGAAAAGLGLASSALGLIGALSSSSAEDSAAVETESVAPDLEETSPAVEARSKARAGKKPRNVSGADRSPEREEKAGAAPGQAAAKSGARGTGRGDSFCGPGRKLGSENDGPGLSWQCIPDNSRSAARSGAAGPAGAAGARGAQGSAAAPVLALLQDVTALLEPTDNVGLVDPDQNGHGVRSRDFNRLAFAALEDADFSGAEQAFRQAAEEAELAGNQREAEINRRNAEIASVDRMLASAARVKGSKNSLRRDLSLKLAAGTARDAGLDDIARRIEGLSARKSTANR